MVNCSIPQQGCTIQIDGTVQYSSLIRDLHILCLTSLMYPISSLFCLPTTATKPNHPFAVVFTFHSSKRHSNILFPQLPLTVISFFYQLVKYRALFALFPLYPLLIFEETNRPNFTIIYRLDGQPESSFYNISNQP